MGRSEAPAKPGHVGDRGVGLASTQGRRDEKFLFDGSCLADEAFQHSSADQRVAPERRVENRHRVATDDDGRGGE